MVNKNIIRKILNEFLTEQFNDYGDIKNVKKLKKDWRKDVTSGTERGITKIKTGLSGNSIKEIVKDLSDKFGISRISYAGRGLNGIAFVADGAKILKLTQDEDEIEGIQKIVGKEIPGIVNYYGYEYYPEYNIYGILMDKAKPISKTEKDIYTTMFYEGANYSDSDFWDDYDEEYLDNLVNRLENPEPEDELPPIGISGYFGSDEDDEEDEEFDDEDESNYYTPRREKPVSSVNITHDDEDESNYYIPKREKPVSSVNITYDELIDYIEKYRELLLKLEANNIATKDLHGENIGQINGELVHFDVMAF
jgi:hypothetical protein